MYASSAVKRNSGTPSTSGTSTRTMPATTASATAMTMGLDTLVVALAASGAQPSRRSRSRRYSGRRADTPRRRRPRGAAPLRPDALLGRPHARPGGSRPRGLVRLLGPLLPAPAPAAAQALAQRPAAHVRADRGAEPAPLELRHAAPAARRRGPGRRDRVRGGHARVAARPGARPGAGPPALVDRGAGEGG